MYTNTNDEASHYVFFYSPIILSLLHPNTPLNVPFPKAQKQSFTPIKNKNKNSIFVYSNLYFCRQQTGR
jgi:hypothetical protein